MSTSVLLPLAEVTPLPGSTYIIPALFLFFVATTVAGALIAVAAQRIIRGVCGLAVWKFRLLRKPGIVAGIFLIGYAIKKTIGFRVSTAVELGGIDIAEHSEVGYDLSPVYYSALGGVRRSLLVDPA